MSFSLNVTTSEQIKEAARAKALEDLAAIRRDCVKTGVTLPTGVQFRGDEATRLALSGAVSALQQQMITEPLAWKTPTGFVELTQSELEAAAQAVVQHVQFCFMAEATVSADIQSSEEPATFDLQAAFDAAMAI